jgi:hypothetical protein
MAAILGSNAEGLLHETVRLVPVAVGGFFAIVLITVLAALGAFQALAVHAGQLLPV